MAQQVTVDQLATAVREILAQYDAEVNEHTVQAVRTVTKVGVRALKAESERKFGGSGRYASGWTSKVETKRFSAQGILYNGKVPGLPHLLEHGHAKRGGGRVSGRIHVAPVEQELITAFEQELETWR